MSSENEVLARRVFEEGINRRRFAVIDEIVGEDYVEHNLMTGAPQGVSGLHGTFQMLCGAFPDLQYVVEDVFSAGDRVCVRSRIKGTQWGTLLGHPASGRRVDFTAIDIIRFEGGKAVEHWGVVEEFVMAQQVGMIPEQTPPA